MDQTHTPTMTRTSTARNKGIETAFRALMHVVSLSSRTSTARNKGIETAVRDLKAAEVVGARTSTARNKGIETVSSHGALKMTFPFFPHIDRPRQGH